MRFLDRDGKPQELEAEGLLATAIQHEIDHLNGRLIIDFLSRLKRDIIVRKFKKQAKAGSDPAGLTRVGHYGRKAVANRPAPDAMPSPAQPEDEGSPPANMRIVFMGTPDFAVPTLSALLGAGHQDRRRLYACAAASGARHGGAQVARSTPMPRPPASRFSPRARCATRPSRRRSPGIAADVAVVVAYGLILPRPVLEAPRSGCLNLHASALPRWRGAAPIARAVMAGDAATAATVMRMDEGLDTGPVCLAEPVPIGPDMTAGELHDVLAERGAASWCKPWPRSSAARSPACRSRMQGVTYAAKIDKGETGIDFTRPAREVHNHVRGLSPFPGAWFAAGEKAERIKVLRTRIASGSGAPGTVLDAAPTVACGEGAVELVELQRAGKRPMPAAELMRGFPLPPGMRLQATGRQ